MKKVPDSNWASEVLALRTALGLTQDEFAVKLGVAGSSVGYWESGEVTPHKRTRERIRAACAGTVPDLRQEAPKSKSRRYSEETIAVLHQALDVILDGAPSPIIEKVSEFLDDFAGKYGIPSELGRPPRRVLRAIPADLSEDVDRLARHERLDMSVILPEALTLWVKAKSRTATADTAAKLNKEAYKRVHPRS